MAWCCNVLDVGLEGYNFAPRPFWFYVQTGNGPMVLRTCGWESNHGPCGVYWQLPPAEYTTDVARGRPRVGRKQATLVLPFIPLHYTLCGYDIQPLNEHDSWYTTFYNDQQLCKSEIGKINKYWKQNLDSNKQDHTLTIVSSVLFNVIIPRNMLVRTFFMTTRCPSLTFIWACSFRRIVLFVLFISVA